MQSRTLVSLCILLVVATFGVQHIAGQCKSCFENGGACIDETSFNLCFNQLIDTSLAYTCPEGTFCSNTESICSPTTQSCDPVMKCGVCDDGKLFACTSRTTFAQCNGTTILDVGEKCPEGYVCDATGGAICVSKFNAPRTFNCD